ncbi:MAG: hypothetical protein WCA54_21540, partial [Pseudolabrys sp.]
RRRKARARVSYGRRRTEIPAVEKSKIGRRSAIKGGNIDNAPGMRCREHRRRASQVGDLRKRETPGLS